MVLAVASLASACTSAITTGSAVGVTTSAAGPSGHEGASNTCPPGGCPVPNCGNDEVVHVSPHVDPSAVGTQDPQTDVEQWSTTLVGGGHEARLHRREHLLEELLEACLTFARPLDH